MIYCINNTFINVVVMIIIVLLIISLKYIYVPVYRI